MIVKNNRRDIFQHQREAQRHTSAHSVIRSLCDSFGTSSALMLTTVRPLRRCNSFYLIHITLSWCLLWSCFTIDLNNSSLTWSEMKGCLGAPTGTWYERVHKGGADVVYLRVCSHGAGWMMNKKALTLFHHLCPAVFQIGAIILIDHIKKRKRNHLKGQKPLIIEWRCLAFSAEIFHILRQMHVLL